MITGLDVENKQMTETALEQEIVAELRRFEPEMTKFLQRCDRIRGLRERARGKHLSPAVFDALNPTWGEIQSQATESRLEAIAKCLPLSPDGAGIVRRVQQERERVSQAEAEQARIVEAQLEEARRKTPPLKSVGRPFRTEALGVGMIEHIQLAPEDYSTLNLTVKTVE